MHGAESIKYLLINRNRILRRTLALVHFNAIRSQELARENVAVGGVKNNSIQFDFAADVEILPRIEFPRALGNLPTSHQPALR